MKIEQEKVFKPVLITLETEEEFKVLWDAIERVYPILPDSSKERDIFIEISNAFSDL